MKKKQFHFNEDSIELSVKPANILVRYIILSLAIIIVGLPLFGIIYNIKDRSGFHVAYLISLGVFLLIGFYFLRLYLWNTIGKEIIQLNDHTIEYHVDYKYFKGSQQKISFEKIKIDYDTSNFKKEQKGVLIFTASNDQSIQCAAILPIQELEQIVQLLNQKYNS